MPARLAGAALVLATLGLAGQPGAAADPAPYTLEVQDASAKVGEPGVLKATLRFNEGYRLLAHYNNRLSRLSSFDEGVSFDQEVVKPSTDGEALVFNVAVTPTKPGSHPINGVFRIGYVEGGDTMRMVSVPLMAKVVGTP
jgi:hypothetical protein